MTHDPATHEIECDVLVIGGGTAGPMAAIKAKTANKALNVVLMEKANVKRSGAISMGMDGLNNAVIPGHATPEQYVKEITVANDGIVYQKAVLAYAENSHAQIRELDDWGVKFEKDQTGDYRVRKVHHLGTYVLPMPEGHHVKKVLYRQLRRLQVNIVQRFMGTRLLTGPDGRIAGAIGVNTRTSEFLVIRAKAVILCMGAAGRLGLPASGYLFGTYENAANAGCGYAMAYHAGAELTNLECYQINPLIKDYNGPACAYVTGPFGGYTANNKGERFIECDYWSGQMMLEFWRELQSGNGPVFLKIDHLAEDDQMVARGSAILGAAGKMRDARAKHGNAAERLCFRSRDFLMFSARKPPRQSLALAIQHCDAPCLGGGEECVAFGLIAQAPQQQPGTQRHRCQRVDRNAGHF